MVIVHKLGDFLFELFPKARTFGDSLDILKEEIEAFYSFGPYRPQVSINTDFIEIMIDVPSIVNQKPEFDKAIALCEKNKFSEAKSILERLIKQNPTVSEYHRILGQIHSEEGSQEEAINSLIDSLKWNPKNGHALTMMGNIFAKHKDDIETARKYYNEAIAQNPDDFIAINNLGTNLLQLGKWEDGLRYLEAAYEINPDYPNTNYGIALANDKLENTLVAFDYSILTLKKCGKNDQTIFNHSLSLAIKTAEQWIKSESGKNTLNEYKAYLEFEGDREIKVEVDDSIPTPAKIEFAENYNREFHLIRHKRNYLAIEHLMMHELVHLDFVIQARKENINMLFIAGTDMKKQFLRDHVKSISRLSKEGYAEDSVAKYMGAIFEGLNRQIFNTPVDLFIEDFLYEKYPALRPYQFISLYGLLDEARKAVTDKKASVLSPKEVLSASKVLSLVNALQFKDLYGFDMVSKFEASRIELNQADAFFKEFNEYRKDRKPAEEYELVQHWGDDLKIGKYFELIDENDFRNKRMSLEGMISSLEKDPLGFDSNQKQKEKAQEQFNKSQNTIGVNMAVVMFMVDALQYFKNLPSEKIKEIAFEIAMLGTQGIKPGADIHYKLKNVPGKDFSGYHLLAYYYVSWSIVDPEGLVQLSLPYDTEFGMARQMFEGGE